jgi:hypothetical protein
MDKFYTEENLSGEQADFLLKDISYLTMASYTLKRSHVTSLKRFQLKLLEAIIVSAHNNVQKNPLPNVLDRHQSTAFHEIYQLLHIS